MVESKRLSDRRKKELELVQNKAARIATGCLKTTSIEILLLEANLFPLSVQHNIQASIAAERCRRFPVGRMANKSTPIIRLKDRNKSWQHVSDEVHVAVLLLHYCKLYKFTPNMNGSVFLLRLNEMVVGKLIT